MASLDNQVTAESKSPRWRVPVPLAFKYPKYRAFWLGTVGMVTGWQVLAMAEGWLAYELTSSPLVLGYLGAAFSIPAMVLSPVGGMLADRIDKRFIIMAVESVAAFTAFVIATLTLLDLIQVWHLVIGAVVVGAAGQFESPAGEAIYPNLIGREALTSGVTLNAATWNGGRIVALAAAGAIIAAYDTVPAFYVACVGFSLMIAVMFFLRVGTLRSRSEGNPAQEMVKGIKFVVVNRVFLSLIGISVLGSLFGTANIMLMPAFAVDILDVGADGQGILLSAGGIGGVAATVWLSTRGNSGINGIVVLGGAVATGLSTILFSLTAEYIGSYYLGIVLMFVQGALFALFTVGSMTALQLLAPDHMRGRVMGYYTLAWSVFPLAALQAGVIAEITGVPWAVAIGGGLVCVFALSLALAVPQVRHLGVTIRESQEQMVGSSPSSLG